MVSISNAPPTGAVRDVMEPLVGGALVQEMPPWKWALRFSSLAPLPALTFCFLYAMKRDFSASCLQGCPCAPACPFYHDGRGHLWNCELREPFLL